METMTIDGLEMRIRWTQERSGIWMATIETRKTIVSLAGHTKEDVIERIKHSIKSGALI